MHRTDGQKTPKTHWMKMLSLTLAAVVCLQSGAMSQQPAPPAAPAAEEEKTEKDAYGTQVKFSGSSGLTGLGTIASQKWGLVQTHVRNPLDSEQSAQVMFKFVQFQERQFWRRISLPRKSTRVMELPVRPGDIAPDARSTDTEIVLFPPDKETLELDRAQGTALMAREQTSFAVLTDSEADEEGSEVVDDEAVTALTAVRSFAGLGPGMSYLTPKTLPRFDIAWDAAHLAAITVDKPDFDAAQRRALRNWIARGGLLVVFSDQVDNAAMAGVIGEAWNIGEVDRVTLTTVKFESPNAQDETGSYELTGQPEPFDAWMETENPITHSRVIAPGWKTHLSVNGWPALLSKRMGRGTLVSITIGGRAWVAAAEKKKSRANGQEIAEIVKPGTERALERLNGLLMPVAATAAQTNTPAHAIWATEGSGKYTKAGGKNDPKPGPGGAPPRQGGGVQQQVQPRNAGFSYVSQLIGYKIVSRGTVAAVLGGFIVALLVGGLFWQKQGVGERLGIAGTLLAVIAAAVLLIVGLSRQGEVKPTSASLQLVEAQPGLRSAHVSGVLGLYNASEQKVDLSGKRGGWLWPVTLTAAGDIQRLRTDDLDLWTWSGVKVPAGATRPLNISMDVQTPGVLEADLRYGPTGLTGTVKWPIESPVEDLMLATPQANMQVKAEPSEGSVKLTLGPGEVLPHNVFFNQGILNQTQRERAETLKLMLEKKEEQESSQSSTEPRTTAVRFDQPTLLGWSEGFDMSLVIEPQLNRVDKALWAVPLAVRDSEPGAEVRVPWPLIPMQQVRARDAKGELDLVIMPLYRPETGEWIKNQMPSAFIGRFMLPPQVLPLKLTAVKLHLDIKAVGRPVRILALREGNPVEVTELLVLDGPDGQNVIDLPADKISMDREGGVLLAFDVQDDAWRKFRAMDAKLDNRLEWDEFKTGTPWEDTGKKFEKLDADGNKQLSLEEVRSEKSSQVSESDFKTMDRDSGGSLSLHEFDFGLLDKNADGRLGLEEYRSGQTSSGRASASMTAMWTIRHFGLEVGGTVQERK